MRFFDINIRSGFADHDVLERMLNGATILKINDEELPIVARLFGIDEPEFKVPSQTECVKAIKEMFDLDVVILTAGDSYSLVMDDETISMLPTPKVEVADAEGRGRRHRRRRRFLLRSVPRILVARIQPACRS